MFGNGGQHGRFGYLAAHRTSGHEVGGDSLQVLRVRVVASPTTIRGTILANDTSCVRVNDVLARRWIGHDDWFVSEQA